MNPEVLGLLGFEPPHDFEFGVAGTRAIRSSSSKHTTIFT